MFMATFTSGGYIDYTAFAKTEERARALVVKGYRKKVMANSGEPLMQKMHGMYTTDVVSWRSATDPAG